VRVGEAMHAAASGLARAIEADYHELNRRFNPWYRMLQMDAEIHTLKAQRLAEEAISKAQAMEIEKQRARIDFLDAQGKELSDDLERLRLRLSAPAQEPAPQKPQSWPDRRRELELKYATGHVNEETTDASQSNAS